MYKSPHKIPLLPNERHRYQINLGNRTARQAAVTVIWWCCTPKTLGTLSGLRRTGTHRVTGMRRRVIVRCVRIEGGIRWFRYDATAFRRLHTRARLVPINRSWLLTMSWLLPTGNGMFPIGGRHPSMNIGVHWSLYGGIRRHPSYSRSSRFLENCIINNISSTPVLCFFSVFILLIALLSTGLLMRHLKPLLHARTIEKRLRQQGRLPASSFRVFHGVIAEEGSRSTRSTLWKIKSKGKRNNE